MNNYRTIQQKDMQKLFPAWEKNIPTLGTKCSQPGNKTGLRFAVTLLLMLVLGVTTAWGQPSEGLYFIANYNNKGYPTETPANHYYLVPAADPKQSYYIDAYYSANFGSENGDPNQPFLTTYKTNKDANSVWRVENVPGETGFYYIIHQQTGRYVIYEPVFSGANSRRKCMHLKTTTTPGNEAKFEITVSETGYAIRPKSVASGNCYFNIASANTNDYYSTGPTSGSPTYFNGLVGLYTDPKDKNGVWFFEKATIDPPTITNNETATNTFTIVAETGATIYYTTDGSTPTASDYTGTGTTPVNVDQTGGMTVIKAIAKGTSDHFPTIVTTYNIPACDRPVISVSGGTVTITCPKAGAAIYYTTNGDPATASSTPYNGPFAKGDASTIRAVATKAGYLISSEAKFMPPTEVFSSSEMTDMNGNYLLTSSFTSTGSVGTSANPFKGTIDGNLNSLTLSYPLVAYADGATIKNVILDNDNVTISDNENGNAGAICCEATGDTRIYNCGVLGGSVEGSNNVGGIVGLLDGRSRVINCYNYAEITSGSNCGGIVGYNNVASTSGNLQTMVMNCMFYGNITGGNAAPIYGGKNIHNKYVSADDTGLNNYCYFLYDEEKVPYVTSIAGANYHGALGAEERYLNRFEFFRMTLNSTRNLAAYYATGDATQKEEMAKWVLDKSIAPYPILKTPGKYPSVVNFDAANAPNSASVGRNHGGKLGKTLTVHIGGVGSNAPSGASIRIRGAIKLERTDKDYDNFNFNYDKVQLPYYNDVGTGNYTKASDGTGRVVTGWKITSITGGTPGSFTTDTYDYPSFNFVDRKCTNKDLFSESGRVFAQGAYWEVPDGVTAITIEPYWAKAVYLSDANYDVTYSMTFSGSGSGLTATTYKYGVTVCGSCPLDYKGQTVYTDLTTALTNLGSVADNKVYDYAVVLVGNYHQAANDALVNNGLPVTFMSADLDGDNEPDNTLFYYHNQRKSVSPVRFDFLNIPGIGMMKRTYDSSMDPEPGIFCPKGWFEVTNTVFIRFGQFEYAGSSSSASGNPQWPKTSMAPLILQGGIYEQFVSCCRTNAQNTNYLLIGGNAWFKNFANGCHTAYANKTPKVPINVAGGDYTNFYLTGIYQPTSNEDTGNAECYIDGGRFTEVAGAGMQKIKGDVTWLINAADITSFYGGGINAAQAITGSISTTISNSYVDEFYGGPKFGDMSADETVTTDATDCHFDKFFGAGYGGTAFNKVLPTPTTTYDSSSSEDTRNWNSWVNAEYKREYNATNGGISTSYDYEFIMHSDGNQTVARFYVNYASLSLATTQNVTSELTGCTIGTFYGGGSLGAVNGDVNSTLTDCTVTGNAFGAGFSASVPTVEVWNAGAYLTPKPTYNRTANIFNNASVKTPKDNVQYVEYTWSNSHGDNDNPFTDTEDGKHYIYTDVSLDGLGSVTGNVTLNIEGTTSINGSVYGGGEESNVAGSTQVNITGGTITQNVFGGGKGVADNFTCDKAMVGVNDDGKCEDPGSNDNKDKGTIVNISNGTVNGNVYGGGEVGRVEWNTQVTIGAVSGEGTPVVNGSVFGAGAGVETHGYGALVRGNSSVTIQGKAKVRDNVYGGGEQATVGRYWVKGIQTTLCPDDENETEVPPAPVGLPDEMPYKTRRGGKCTVIVQGSAQVGPDEGATETAGHVFGAGKGITPNYVHTGNKANWSRRMVDYNSTKHATGEGESWDYIEEYSEAEKSDANFKKYVWEYFADKDKYLEFLQTLALVTGTDVTIGGGAVKGNVYGGSESGFVQDDTDVKVTGGTIGTSGATTDGNVFGGGKGLAEFAEAGKVKGNTEVTISGGTAHGNVYGGGELGDVGTIAKNTTNYNYMWTNDPEATYPDYTYNNTGVCIVTINDGTIGTEGVATTGHVFGAGKGLEDTYWCEKAMAYKTNVSITKGTIRGSVYGGGQLGRVENNTAVTIGAQSGTDEFEIKGDVFGAGAGVATHGYSALVRGNATVTVQGKAKVGKSVYGGGEIASVGRFRVENSLPKEPLSGGTCTVTIGDYAKIGTGAAGGEVYGACKGVTPNYANNAGHWKDDNQHHNFESEAEYLSFLKTLALTSNTIVTIGGTNSTVYGSVFGGGQRGITLGTVSVSMTGGTINQDVYGGGALADTNTGNWNSSYGSVAGITAGTTIVTGYYTRSGSGTNEDPYEYTEVTAANKVAEEETTYYSLNSWSHATQKSARYTTTVSLTGGLIKGDAYGGGLGQKTGFNGATGNIAAVVWGDIAVTLNGTKFDINKYEDEGYTNVVKSGRVFGCNNLYGSPQGNVTVTVQRTVAGNTSRSETADKKNANATYEVAAVYGGGNLADYTATGMKTHVIINGCGDTSIQYVYGGGNAAAVPETDVDINATYEIGAVFGGGNGKDKYKADNGWQTNPGANVSGNANTMIYGGTIHEAFGGSNEKGAISGTVSINTQSVSQESPNYCPLNIGKLYGAGKNADIEGDLIVVMGCMPGDENKTDEVYGGAENANVKGNVELTITSGSFGKVFGGNNTSGAIFGHIILNIEESGCTPIKIDELYLGGYNAAYSVYGYYENGTIEGTDKPKYDPISSANDNTHTAVYFGDGSNSDHTKAPYAHPVLNVISATYIGQVFGGGLGSDAIIYGNPTVNINQTNPLEFSSYDSGTKKTTYTAKTGDLGSIGEDGIFGGGNEASVYGNTTVNIGNLTTVDWIVLVLDDSGQSVLDANNKPLTQTITGENLNTVLGANITGDVYGGGNHAEVTGNTHVNICAVEDDDPATTDVVEYTSVTPGTAGVTIQGTQPVGEFGRGVFGGGNQGNVSGDSYVYFGAGSVNQSVYGGGCDADVLGNTHVTMLGGYVFDGVCGGGLKGSVGTFTRTTETGHTEGSTHDNGEICIGGKPDTFTSGTGKCTVVITGGQVGPATVATQGMTRAAADGGPVSEGWVWGAGRGVVNSIEDDPDTDFRTYVNETDVTIGGTAFIMEGVIGGGEFGRVRGNTLVKIEGGQIGVGKDKAADGKPVRYTEEQWTTAETAVSAGNASSINTIAAAMPACSHFPYGRNTGTEQAPNWVYDTYDPYADEYNTAKGSYKYPGGSTNNASDGKTWIGCVFGGGSGYFPYKTTDINGVITNYDWLSSAGLVEGNTEVRISGGHILTNVYGGNEYTNVKGKCRVTMSGGTIGVPRTLDQIKANPMIGNIFGAGKGDPRVHFNKSTNVGEVEIEITGGVIYGSVFGGGEDGHVLKDVSLTIGTDSHTGPTIGTWGTSYFEGNVFGGGRGFSGDAYTAGNVAGSVDLKIKGGNILGSVFGGGRLGSVGYGLFDEGAEGYGKMRADNDTEEGFAPSGGFTHGRGHIDITISGGTIGNNYEYDYIAPTVTGNALTTAKANMPNTEHDAKNILTHTKGGNVFAGGMGRMYQLDGTTPISAVDWWKLGCVKSSKLTISGGTIKSCVYGGGELGQVVGKHTAKNAANEDVSVGTEVIITGGTIGTEIQDGGTTKYTFGSVFGGGYGSLAETLTHTGGKPVSYPKYIAGRVKAGTKVNMTAGAVKASVYGGGEMAAVGESTVLGETLTDGFSRDTHVIISGGTIGKTKDTEHNISYGGAKMGNVYGGGSGHNNTVRSGHIYGNTNVTISGTPTIYHNVYGGGAYGSVGEFDYSLDDTHKVNGINSLHTSGTGVANITITGGTIGIDGKENGMVFGSSRGDINRPEERDDHTAWVYDTHVTIGTANAGTSTPTIKGSVYGSGENGHTFNDAVVTVHSGTIGVPENPEYAYRGNVYGGGCGTDKYYENHDEETHDGNGQLYNPLAGVVYGNATVNITGGNVVRNVYGAGAMGSVGKTNTDGTISGGKTTVTISGGRVGVDGNGEGNGNGHVFGAARGEYGLDNSFSSVRESEVNIQYETTPDGDNEDKTEKLIAGSVFGGGEAGIVKESVTVNMKGGLVLKDVYGGGALANTQTNNWDATNNTWAADKIEEDGKTTYTTTVNLTGGSVGGDAYGGGLGQKTGFNGGTSDIEATVYGDITVNLGTLGTAATNDSPAIPASATAFNISYDDTDDKDENNNYIQVVGSGRVFGCNNLNGSPQGDVTVNVYKTVAGNVGRTVAENPTAPAQEQRASRDANVPHTYELAAVYGGGNLADYTATGKKASVTIHTCDVSVQHVYGGGNAAAVPETDVLVKGAWEIDHVFGGGNGKDKFKKGNQWILNEGANVSGNTNTLLIGGYIHEAYGGSNEKGTIGGNVTINTNSEHEDCACDLELVKLYGAGKNADIEGDLIVVLGCAPETKTEEVYGGAENANVRGNVELTITSGTFGKVFGGNNQSGAIFGHIVLNVEETNCRPIIIDELYGCGNNAAYSVYGYKNGGTDWEGFPIYVPRTSTDDGTAVTFDGKPHTVPDATTGQYDDPEVNIISCTRIGKVFGGGWGSGAIVYGNPTVNIDQIYGKAYSDADKTQYDAVATSLGEIGDVFGGGNEANVVGNTNVNIGTKKEVWLHQSVDANGNYTMYPANTGSGNGIPVVGANITGNVYGGGNEAEVTGDTNVNIGKKSE